MKNNEEILIATSNKGKVKEFKKLFQTHNIFSLTDLGIVDAVEDGSSFLENALIKAKHGAKESKKYSESIRNLEKVVDELSASDSESYDIDKLITDVKKAVEDINFCSERINTVQRELDNILKNVKKVPKKTKDDDLSDDSDA